MLLFIPDYSSILAKISASLNRWYSCGGVSVIPHLASGLNRIRDQPTSSPSLMGLPPQPGSKTLSPTLTETGVTTPSLLVAPGPTAMTVASGRGEEVADEGRKIPVAVFYIGSSAKHRVAGSGTRTNRLGLESLDEDSVE